MLFMNIYQNRLFFLLYINVVKTMGRDRKDNTSRRAMRRIVFVGAILMFRQKISIVNTEDKYCEGLVLVLSSREVGYLDECSAARRGEGRQFGNARPKRGIVDADVGLTSVEQAVDQAAVHYVVHQILHPEFLSRLQEGLGFGVVLVVDVCFGSASRERRLSVNLDGGERILLGIALRAAEGLQAAVWARRPFVELNQYRLA